MKRIVFLSLVFAVVCSFTLAGVSAKEVSKESHGEKLFMKHCNNAILTEAM